jgi:hypothetical protein
LAVENTSKRFVVKVLDCKVLGKWSFKMSAFARSFSQSSGIQIGELIRPAAKVCGAVLFAWLLVATYGLDLSAGFF